MQRNIASAIETITLCLPGEHSLVLILLISVYLNVFSSCCSSFRNVCQIARAARWEKVWSACVESSDYLRTS